MHSDLPVQRRRLPRFAPDERRCREPILYQRDRGIVPASTARAKPVYAAAKKSTHQRARAQNHALDAADDGPTSIVWADVASIRAAGLSAAAPGHTAATGQNQSQPEEQHREGSRPIPSPVAGHRYRATDAAARFAHRVAGACARAAHTSISIPNRAGRHSAGQEREAEGMRILNGKIY